MPVAPRGRRGTPPGGTLARRRLGEALIELGRTDEAIVELELAEQLLDNQGERARVRTFLARACAAAGQVGRARSLLDSAANDLRTSPFHHADVFLALAGLAENPEEARDHYRSALACYRDPADPTTVRIRALLDRHEHESALDVVPGQATADQQRQLR